MTGLRMEPTSPLIALDAFLRILVSRAGQRSHVVQARATRRMPSVGRIHVAECPCGGTDRLV